MARTWQLDEDVFPILQAAKVTEDRVVLPEGQLDRKLYEKVNKVLVGLGGKWHRQEQAHLFASDPRVILATVLDTGHGVNLQQQYQAFWTPVWLADQMVERAGVNPGEAVCDPSAGTGRLLDAVLRVPGFREHSASRLVGYEIQPDLVRALEQKYGPHVRVWGGDFLQHQNPAQHERLTYHVIVMNPPYARNQDIAHVLQALGWLEGGGRLVAVMPASIQWRQGKAIEGFRTILEQYDHTITLLPDDTFKESGTMVQTVLLRCVRPERPGMHARDVMTNVVQGVLEACAAETPSARAAALHTPLPPTGRSREQLSLF